MTTDVLAAWQADGTVGLDAVMLAPTRDLVAELNQQARAQRLHALGTRDPGVVGPTRRLADGNDASVGELVITRENNRNLRTSATDWVKNGDRWSVLAVHDDGALTVQHLRHRRTVQLPAQYVAESTELGYACTVHTAQGVTADTMHGLATGTESRQQLYTLLTRGAQANHVYLEVVGDGDPHSVIHPTLVRPLTPTDILESMLARDDAQHSATSMIREQANPRHRLGHAARRYLDSLYLAAEDVVGTAVVKALDGVIEELLPGLADEPAWPALRAHLMLLAASGTDPVAAVPDAVSDRELVSAGDRAAVLDSRWTPPGCVTPPSDRWHGCQEFLPRWQSTPYGAGTWASEPALWRSSPPPSTRTPSRQSVPGICPAGPRTDFDLMRKRSATSKCGEPPWASRPATDDPPVQRGCRRRPRAGSGV